MSKLRQLLSYLERPDVTEIVFKTGAPARLSTSSRGIPVTVAPLQRRQIMRFFDETPVIPLVPRRDCKAATHRVTLLQRTYDVRVSQASGELEIRVSIPGGQGATAEIPQVDEETGRSSEDSGSHIRAPRRDSSSTRAALGRPSAHFQSRAGKRANIDTVRAPSSGHRDSLRSTRQEGKASKGPSLTVERADPPANDAAPPSQRAMDARLEQGFGLDNSGPGRPPPSLEVLGNGLELDLEAVETGSPISVGGRDDSAPLIAPDLPPIERNEVTFEANAVEVDAAPLAIETNRFEGDVSAPAVADPDPFEALESTAVDTRPRPQARPAAVSVVSAPVPASRAPAFDETANESSLADESGFQPTNVARSLLELLRTARGKGATDVHVVAQAPPRIRIAGSLAPAGPTLAADELERAVLPLLRISDSARLKNLGYADFAIDLPEAGRLRVNVCRQRTGLKACFRLLSDGPQTMEELGLPEEVGKLLNFHQGLVMIAGPNGHGKTATMASIVDAFNARKPLHILTVEDPVEIIHPRKKALVTQREVGRHTRTFQTALAAALREDPDIIAIGELRDRETVEMALSAAETGHLVFATMSTPSASKTIDRLIDMFPPDHQSQVRATLAGALKLVLSQRLVRRRDGAGRTAAFEMITGNVPLWSLIRDNKLFQLPSLLQRGRNFGMLRLDESLRDLVERGVVDRAEAAVHADDPRVFEQGAARKAR